MTVPLYIFSGRPLLDPAHLLSQCEQQGLPVNVWYGKANGFHLPVGKHPGIGHLLMLYEDFLLHDRTTLHTLGFQQGATVVNINNLVILSAEALYPGAVITPQTAMLVKVADTRHFMARTAINKGYNVYDRTVSSTTPTLDPDTLNSSAEWTWAQVIQDIWNNFLPPYSLDVSNVSFPSYNPYDLCFFGMSAWDALFEVLNKINLVLSLHPDGTYYLYETNSADDNPASVWATQYDNLADQSWEVLPTIVNYPESVTVYFPRKDGLNPPHGEVVTTVSILPSVTTRAGVTDIIWNPKLAEYDGTNTLTNGSDLTAIATDLATTYLQGLTRLTGITISIGLLDAHPNAYYDSISWYDFGEGLMTETRTALARKPPVAHPDCEEPLSASPDVILYLPSTDPDNYVLPQDVSSTAYGYIWSTSLTNLTNINTDEEHIIKDYYGSIALPGQKLQCRYDTTLGAYTPIPFGQNAVQLARVYKVIPANTTVDGTDIWLVGGNINALTDDIVELSEMINDNLIYEWCTSDIDIDGSEQTPVEVYIKLFHENDGCQWRIIGRACNPEQQ